VFHQRHAVARVPGLRVKEVAHNAVAGQPYNGLAVADHAEIEPSLHHEEVQLLLQPGVVTIRLR